MNEGSDSSGWWQASDGKWYPPESRSDATPAAAGPLPEPEPDPGKVTFDASGWIQIEEPIRVAAGPPPKPPWKAGLPVVLAIIVAVLVVGAAAVTFIPRGSDRAADAADTASGDDAPSSDGVDDVDPLTLDSVLSNINVRFADVGEGYTKAIDGSIDPIGGDGCTQPRRPFAPVAGTNWAAYVYRPTGFGGLEGGHLAASVTVFEHTPDANKRLQQEKEPDYVDCLQRWDRQVWFDGYFRGTGFKPHREFMEPMPVNVAEATAIGWRYTSTFIAKDGREYGVYTDHIIFTRGRIRVWIEASSMLDPFDQARRDLLVGRISQRVEDAIS